MDYPEVQSKYAFVGGTLFSALPSIGAEDFMVTGIMAVFGAVVSYLASLLIKHVHRVLKRKRKNEESEETP